MKRMKLNCLISLMGVLLQFHCVNVYGGVKVNAEALFQDGKWEQSIAAFGQLIKDDSTNAEHWYRLGRSHLELKQYREAVGPLQQALVQPGGEQPKAQVLFSLAKVYAVFDDEEAVLETLQALRDTGARPYQAIRNAAEFNKYKNMEAFNLMVEKLKPCGEENRAFDFWIGEWRVTAPGRGSWYADSSITVSNDGCSIHEHYVSQGGYTGSSINFYDKASGKWHQTWIDNQGAPLYLDGGVVDGKMILSDSNSRITWSLESDGRVRQLWESTSDQGTTWTTAFDGYYERKPAGADK